MLYETKMNHPPHRFVDNVDAPQPTEPATSATREYAPCSDGADSRHGGEAPPTAEQRTPIHPHKHSPFLNNHQPHRRHRCRPRIARRRWMKRWITIYSYLYFFDIILFLILIYYLVKFRWCMPRCGWTEQQTNDCCPVATADVRGANRTEECSQATVN